MTRTTVLGWMLAATACNSMALSLGRPHGPAVLGQPLAVSFELRLDAEDNVESACIEAEVIQGDTRIDPSRVRTVVTGSGQNAVVKVTTSTAIDEPVVTVNLTAGCTQNTSRRYVLLTELPADLREPATASALASAVPLVPAVAPAPLSPSQSASGVTPQSSRTQRQAVPTTGAATRATTRQRNATSGKGPAPAAQRQARQAAPGTSKRPATTTAGAPRLQLETAALPVAALGGLKLSEEVSVSSENVAQRASAAAQWRALNTQAQDIANQDSQQAEAQSLRDSAAKDKSLITGLQDQLLQAEQARYANGLVYSLLAWLLAALLAVAYFWRRNRVLSNVQPPAWWIAQNTPDPGEGAALVSDGDDPQRVSTANDPGDGPRWVSGAKVDVDVSALSPLAKPPRKSHRIHPEDLADVQQHADFFVSLGQYDQAIEVLCAYIGDHPTGSPVAYLDLLQIYQSLGRNTDYLQLGHAFEEVFNAVVPEPTLFKHTGSGLEDYPDVLRDIETAWGTPDVLVMLEELVRSTPHAKAGPFALGAYRELLLLHAVALAESDPALIAPRLDVADRRSGWASNFTPLQDSPATPAVFAASLPVPTDRRNSSWDPVTSGSADLAATYDLDIDLNLDLDLAASDTRPLAQSTQTTNILEFDLFDPDVEEDIAPKSTRR
mgnify:FL=1